MTAPAPAAATPATDPATPTDPQASAAATPTPVPPVVEPPASENPTETIARLEAEIKAARAEAGKARVTAKQNAADEARNELAQSIGKAIGLVQDEPVDPVKLTEQLTAKDAEARQAKVELAVFRAAESANGDPVALLDSRDFLAKLADTDPSDNEAVAAVITAAVAANPRLGKAPTSRLSAPNPAQGTSAAGAPDLETQIAAAQKAGDVMAVIRLQNQKLTNPKQ